MVNFLTTMQNLLNEGDALEASIATENASRKAFFA
jgi:hypothetical protein